MAEENKEFSQLDFGGVLRSAHEDKNKALRVTSANTSVPARYSRVALTYNSSDSLTNAKFYEGSLAEIRHIEFVDDIGGSLNNTYFTLYTEQDESLYHVWYNVNGGGTDPAPSGSCGIEIEIETNDPAEIVKLATQRYLEQFSEEFVIQELASTKIKVENARMGTATNTSDFGTGFQITTIQEGEEKLIKNIDIPFDGKTRNVYNTQEKKFEVFPISSADVTITGEVDVQNPNSPEIINLSIANKNVEVSQLLPDNTKRVRLSVRGNLAKLQLAFNSGETTTNYRTIYRGSTWVTDSDVDIPNGTSLYLLSSQDNIVVEIEVWKRV